MGGSGASGGWWRMKTAMRMHPFLFSGKHLLPYQFPSPDVEPLPSSPWPLAPTPSPWSLALWTAASVLLTQRHGRPRVATGGHGRRAWEICSWWR